MFNALRGDTLYISGAEEVLDFTHVSDVAKGIVLASQSDIAAGKTYNLTRSSDRIHTLLSAAKLIISYAKHGFVAVRERDANFPSRGRLSIKRAQEDLGYAPKVDVEDGFQHYLKWFRESEFWKKKI
jgi:dTDP-glucose 4,6-dehydratase